MLRKSLINSVITGSVASILMAATHANAVPPGAAKDDKGSYAYGRLLIKSKPGFADDKLTKLLNKHNAASTHKIKQTDVNIVVVPPGLEKKIMGELQSEPGIEFVELDRLIPMDFTPNDPSFGSQWHHKKIGSPAAWDVANANGLVIAILDTGTDSTHPDLAPVILPGWNVVSQNTDTTDVQGHGTWTAGTAAAAFNNGIGVAGVASGAKILPVRITNDAGGYAYWSDVAKGVTWAADHGAKVVSNSYASYASSSVSSAAAYLKSKGGIMFTSEGNDGVLNTYPADPNIMVVSATDGNDVKTSWSTYGPSVDVSAPGQSIYTTARGGRYQSVAGTSFSAPMSAGLAALIFGTNASLTPNDVEKIMKTTAVDLGAAGRDDFYGDGRINAAAAVAAAKTYVASDAIAPTISIRTPVANATVKGIVSVDFAAGDNVGVTKVELYVNGQLYTTDTTAPYSIAWDTTALGNAAATLTAIAYDAASNKTVSSAVKLNVMNTADTIAPVATILSPANNATVSGNVAVKASATDDLAVTGMTVSIDGKQVATATVGSISYSWNTRKASAGLHTILVTAKDAAGNTGQSSITVKR